MKKIVCPLLFLLLFLFAACENKSSPLHKEEIDDEDTDVVSDADEENDEDVPLEAIYDVKVSENEKNVLSCRLTFSTSEERKTFVKYYSEKHAGYRISEDSAKTDHYFFLWGMRPNRDYTIEIYSDGETPELLATENFHAGKLPDFIHEPRLVANEKEMVSKGFVLLTQTTENAPIQEPLLYIVDNDGFIVWYFRYDFPGEAFLDDPAYIARTQTVFAGVHKYPSIEEVPEEEGIEIDLEGNLLWKSVDIASSYYSLTGWHHEYKLLDDDTVIYLQSDIIGMLLTDRLFNVDRDYNLLWDWGYLDSDLEWPACYDWTTDWCDWTHTNSAMLFRDDKTAYLNSAREGFFKVDMDARNIVWRFGKNGDFAMLSEHAFPWPDFPHDPKFYDGSRKRLLFYDNGSLERFYSRVIEYEIDEEAKTAEITFEFDGLESGRGWFSSGWGDADYLENGNILVTKGMVEETDYSTVFEITREGQVVWELYMWHSDVTNEYDELYNAEKFVPELEFLDE